MDNKYTWTKPKNPFEYKQALGWIDLVTVVVGFCGTIGVVLLMFTKPWRGTALSVILIALALSDILILFSTTLGFFLRNVYNIEYYLESDALCKLFQFMVHATHMTSPWLLVCVVLERMVNVFVTMESLTRWTQRPLVAVIVVMTVWVGCYAINSHFLAFYELHVSSYRFGTDGALQKYCFVSSDSENYSEFIDKQFLWLDLFISFIVPFSMAFFGSIIILANNARIQRAEPASSSLSLPKTTFRATLLILAIVSICTLGPQIIYILVMMNGYSPTNDWFYDMFIFNLLAVVAHVNAAVKFYLYVMTSSEFRSSLMSMLRRRRN